MAFSDPIAGTEVLIRNQLQSENFTTTTGWQVKRDGTATFNQVTIRNGTTISGVSLYYTPTPGLNNLFLSIADAAGTDQFGNTYPKGISVGSNVTRQIVLDQNGNVASIAFSVNQAFANSSGTILEAIGNAGGANEYLTMQFQGPTVKTFTDSASMQLNSQNKDGSSNANLQLRAGTGSVSFDKTRWSSSVDTNSPNFPDGAWTAYTPTWTTSTGLNLPSFGNAIIDCAWTRFGRTIVVRFRVVFGSTTNFGAAPTTGDNWRFGLPVTASGLHQVAGFVELNASAAARAISRARFTTTGAFEMEIDAGRVDSVAITNTGLVDSLSPWTWASGDSVLGLLIYES